MELRPDQVDGLLKMREEYLGKISRILKHRWEISSKLQEAFGPFQNGDVRQANFTVAHARVSCGVKEKKSHSISLVIWSMKL